VLSNRRPMLGSDRSDNLQGDRLFFSARSPASSIVISVDGAKSLCVDSGPGERARPIDREKRKKQ
jgi:hypothetical protein